MTLLDRLASTLDPSPWAEGNCTCINCRVTNARMRVGAKALVRQLLAQGSREEWEALLDEARNEGGGR